MKSDPRLTAEDINQYFSAMDDSVTLINETIDDNTRALEIYNDAEGVKAMMKRNTDHLELQLDKDWATEDSRDKSSYTDAITAGVNYING
jgi:SUMO ligase MMS21 Smc5/6 complex component